MPGDLISFNQRLL